MHANFLMAVYVNPNSLTDLLVMVGVALLWSVLHRIVHMVANSYASSNFKNPYEIEKFNTSAWKFVNFSLTSSVGIYILIGQDWVLSKPALIIGWPYHTLTTEIRIFYSIGFGSYLYALFNSIEPGQSLFDLGVMVFHHFVTLFLLAVSYIAGFYRIGCVVLILHEVSDPFMEIAKMFKYSGYQRVI
jgi:hypothetical protein